MVVGLTRSRGVNGVMAVEDVRSTRRGQQFNVERYGQTIPYTEMENTLVIILLISEHAKIATTA